MKMSGTPGKETEVKEVLLYLGDKLADFFFAMLGVVVGHYINRWLEKRNQK